MNLSNDGIHTIVPCKLNVEYSVTIDSAVAFCQTTWFSAKLWPLYSFLSSLYCIFSDWRPASKVAACRGRPRAAESRSDARAGCKGAPGESGQGATGTAVAQKPQQERHRRTTPTRQRLQLILYLLTPPNPHQHRPDWQLQPPNHVN